MNQLSLQKTAQRRCLKTTKTLDVGSHAVLELCVLTLTCKTIQNQSTLFELLPDVKLVMMFRSANVSSISLAKIQQVLLLMH